MKTEANGDIAISAAGGDLLWKSVPITGQITSGVGNRFTITLDHTKKYRNKRLDEQGEAVSIVTGSNNFSVNFVIGEARLSSYRLFDGECAFDGGVEIGLPEWLAGSIEAGLTAEQVVLDAQTIPGVRANAGATFNPAGLMGDAIGKLIGGGSLEFEMDTLPETNPKYISAKGDLDIADFLYVKGELVLKWGNNPNSGNMVFVPDRLELFARIGEGGIPLVPPVVVAYINGFGGGIYNLYDTVTKGFHYVPPVTISGKGAITDVTGKLFSIDEATINIGVGKFSSTVDEATILQVLKFKDVGYGFGVDEYGYSKKANKPAVKLYFYFNGNISLDVPVLTVEGSVSLDAELFTAEIIDAILQYQEDGKFTDEVKDFLYDSFNISGTAKGKIFVDLGKWGKPGVEGELSASKTKLSGSVGVDLKIIHPSIGIVYHIKEKKTEIHWFSALAPAGGTEDSRVELTNVKAVGSYHPGGALPGNGGMRLLARGANSIPDAKEGQIVTIYSNEKSTEIKVFKVGEGGEAEYKTLDMDDIVIWQDTGEGPEGNENLYRDKGKFFMIYVIPADGQYLFKGDGEELAYDLDEITPLPEFKSISTTVEANDNDNKINTTWDLVNVGDTPLSIKLLLKDALTDKLVMDLTAPELINYDVNNPENHTFSGYPSATDPMEITSELPETLSSGSYYISAELLQKYKNENGEDDGYITVHTKDTEPFDYTNPEALDAPKNLKAEYIGNGAFEVSWDQVSEADGYRITVQDEDGRALPDIAEMDTDKASKTSIIIQGGTLFIDGTDRGLQFGETYKINVQAYKNVEVSMGEGEGERKIAFPILGKAGTLKYKLTSPKIPVLNVFVEDGNAVKDKDGNISYYATNSDKPELIVHSDTKADIKIYRNGVTEPIYSSAESTTSCETDLNLNEDGYYQFYITAKSSGGDMATENIRIYLDTQAPTVDVDKDSSIAYNGSVNINGFTEPGSIVSVNDHPAGMDGGLFNYRGTMGESAAEYSIMATDEAGNATTRFITVVYATAQGTSGGSDKGTKEPLQTTEPNTIIVDASLGSGGSAGVYVSNIDVNNAADITVTVNVPEGADSLAATINRAALQELLDGEVSSFTLDAMGIRAGFDLQSLQSILEQSEGDLTITITPVKELSDEAREKIGDRPVYDISISYLKNGVYENISLLGSGTATISIPYTPKAWEDPGYIYGVYVDGNGNAITIPGSYYDEKLKALIIPAAHLSIYGVGYYKSSSEFIDVGNHWAKNDIEFVINSGLFSGTSANTFSPDIPMTRGMFVTVLGRLANADTGSYKESSFIDVDKDLYYAGYIEWASENGIVKGTGNSKFSPDLPITREEMAVMIRNYVRYIEFTLPTIYPENIFADHDKISPYANEAITLMQTAGLLKGKESNIFDPQGKATRAEAAAILHRFVEFGIQ